MAEYKTVEQVIRSINKEFGDIVRKGFKPDENKVQLSSLGSISLDFCTYGGLHPGRFIELSGPESSGKTTVAAMAAGAYQRTHPAESILFVDMEGTFDPTWAIKVGLKVDTQFLYYETVGQSGEKVLNHIVDFIRAGVRFIIIDSLPMLVPEQVQSEDDLEQKSMGGNAKLLSDFTSRYTGLVHKTQAIVIGINQLRDNMTKYGDPIKTTGGRAWKHACSMRLMVKKGEFFDQNGEKVKKKDAQSPAGHFIEMHVLKNKDAPWDRKLGFTKLHYWKGIDYISDLIEVALYYDLIKSASAGWFVLLDEEGNPLQTPDGKDLKIQGKIKLAEYLKNNKEIAARIYSSVKQLMENKESGFLAGFEAMLGVKKNFVAGDEDFEDVTEEDEEEEEN